MGDTPGFLFAARPFESAGFQSFIKEKEAISFPKKSLQPVGFPPAEQKEYILLKRIHPVILLDYGCQSIDAAPQVGIAADDIYTRKSGSIIKHPEQP
jgi:hypothetical protein